MMRAIHSHIVSDTIIDLMKTFLLFLLAAVSLHGFLQSGDNLVQLLAQSCIHAFIYTGLYLAVFSCSPWSLSLSWLGLPLVLFSATWLRWYWAIALTASLLAALYLAIRSTDVTTDNALAFKNRVLNCLVGRGFAWGAVPVLCWVALTGAGGYGYQSPDYVMHNGRLEDLIRYSWPVFYQSGALLNGHSDWENGGLLVTYSGYYLPGALIGKWFGLDAAREFMHYWTIAGCWLACRWLVQLSAIRSTMLASGVLLLFGGWDIVGLVISGVYYIRQLDISLNDIPPLLLDVIASPATLDFWPNGLLESSYFFGNYVSLSASLIWAPHHSIAGWLVIALLLQTAQQESYRYTGLIYALLVLWSPLVLVALALFPLAMLLLPIVFRYKEKYWTHWFSFASLPGILLLLIFGFYYASASMMSNPAGFLELKYDWSLAVFLLFHILCWGIYAAVICPALQYMTGATRHFFIVLCITFFLLPLIHYGTYNDLMVRASAPLLFALAIFILKALALYLRNGKSGRAALLIAVLVPGMISGVLNMANAVMYHDTKVKGESVIDYGGGWQFLGSGHSAYVLFFSAPLSKRPSGE